MAVLAIRFLFLSHKLGPLPATFFILFETLFEMTCFHVAFVMPVNTAEASQRLSRGELWKGCELLAREPQVFTDAISSCTIKSDSDTRMSRTLHFKTSAVSEMDQEITLIKNHKVCRIRKACCFLELDQTDCVVRKYHVGCREQGHNHHISRGQG
jgi:hypothetical protein